MHYDANDGKCVLQSCHALWRVLQSTVCPQHTVPAEGDRCHNVGGAVGPHFIPVPRYFPIVFWVVVEQACLTPTSHTQHMLVNAVHVLVEQAQHSRGGADRWVGQGQPAIRKARPSMPYTAYKCVHVRLRGGGTHRDTAVAFNYGKCW